MRKTFKSAIHEHLSLHVGGLFNGEVSVGIHEGNKLLKGLTVAVPDAPALALAILGAAGIEPKVHVPHTVGTHEQLETLSADLVQYIEYRDAEAAALEKLTKRRDEVARSLSPSGFRYYQLSEWAKNAVDRIVELEGKAQSSGD